MRILICDDDVMLNRLLFSYLRRVYRAEIKIAHDGQAALSHLEHFEPDLILLDFMLPKLNGEQLLGEIEQRHRGGRSAFKIVLCTVMDMKKSALARRVDGFLQKPATVAQIRQAVDAALHLSKAAALSA